MKLINWIRILLKYKKTREPPKKDLIYELIWGVLCQRNDKEKYAKTFQQYDRLRFMIPCLIQEVGKPAPSF